MEIISWPTCVASLRNVYLTWLYNSTLHIKLAENSPIHKKFHPTNNVNVLGIDNLDE